MWRLFLLVGLVGLVGCGGGSDKTFTADQVADALKAHGLPIDERASFTADTDPNKRLGRPGEYTSKVNFRDNRLKADSDDLTKDAQGMIETFKSESDAKRWYDYTHSLASGSPLLTAYVYRQGTVVLRLVKDFTPDQATEYERALKASVP